MGGTGRERGPRSVWPALFVLGLAAGCAARTPVATDPPPVPGAPADRALYVALTWQAPVDLDLYLTDPVAETLYFANNPTRAGARLERDARCGTVSATAPALEYARAANPAPGRYRVGVDFIETCGSGVRAVPFRVAVDLRGTRREVTGTVELERFQVVVFEFDVGEDGSLQTNVIPPFSKGEAAGGGQCCIQRE